MKIAICTKDASKDSAVDVRFGRAGCFAVYDETSGQWEFVVNDQNMQASQGAGLQAAQHIIDAGADVLIAANVGPKAMAVMRQEKIKVYQLSEEATAADALRMYQEKGLREMSAANVDGHWV